VWNPAGPGPSYGDVLEDGTRAGVDNEFTQRNTTFMTWNLLHLARMLRAAGGFPAYGNQRREWDAGARFDFPNPESRVPLLATSYVPGRAHCADGLAAAARRSSTLWVGGTATRAMSSSCGAKRSSSSHRSSRGQVGQLGDRRAVSRVRQLSRSMPRRSKQPVGDNHDSVWHSVVDLLRRGAATAPNARHPCVSGRGTCPDDSADGERA
jgi:hypothetical protein